MSDVLESHCGKGILVVGDKELHVSYEFCVEQERLENDTPGLKEVKIQILDPGPDELITYVGQPGFVRLKDGQNVYGTLASNDGRFEMSDKGISN